jgi:hypothetical protein
MKDQNKDYWQAIAMNANDGGHPVIPLIMSCLLGLGVASVTKLTAPAICATGLAATIAIQSSLKKGSQFDTICEGELLCISLNPQQLKEYIAQFGLDRVLEELATAAELDVLISEACEDLLDAIEKDLRVSRSAQNNALLSPKDGEFEPIPNPYLPKSEDFYQAVSNGIVGVNSRSLVDRVVSTNQSLLSILTANPASTILVGEPGTGKTMTGSSMGREWVKDGHHVYYIDSKMDEKESSLWEDACSDRYQFDGTLIRDPNEWCKRLIEAFDEFENFRLHHLGDGKQTICVLDELPAVMSAFKSYKPDPAAALNFINRIVNTLPSRNCHILLLAQNPSCTDTLPSGTIGTLKKIILAKAGSESQLAEWGNLTMMRSVKLDTLSAAIRKSPVNRGCYSSIFGEWLPMQSLIRKGIDYDRDTLSGVNTFSIPQNSPRNTALTPNTDVNARTHAGSGDSVLTPCQQPDTVLTQAILDYFEAVDKKEPKSSRDISMATRIRKLNATGEQIVDALGVLLQSKDLILTDSGYVSPLWQAEDDRGN